MSTSKRLITQNKCFMFSICMHACMRANQCSHCLIENDVYMYSTDVLLLFAWRHF